LTGFFVSPSNRDLPEHRKPLASRQDGAIALHDDLFSLHISSDAFTGKDRIEAFRENLGKSILRVEMEPLDDQLEFDLAFSALPGFGMANGWISPVRNSHTTELIDNDDIVLVYLNDGAARYRQNGREIEARPGDVVLTENNQAGSFLLHTQVHSLNLRFSRDRLLPLLGADTLSSGNLPILRQSPALDFLRKYAGVVESGTTLTSPQTRKLAVDHLYDLAALAIGANREGEAIAKRRGLRAARLRAIKATIVKNLDQRNLSAGAVALRHGITQRYLQMLFEAEGTTFSEFVLSQRLKRAHRLLSDQAFDSQSISSIAFEVGFNDLSYFNRTFRRYFGVTPSDVRGAKS
jgi:AraC-like DNA-binding protein